MCLTLSLVRHLIFLAEFSRQVMTSETAVLDRCPFFEQFQPKHLDKLMMLSTPVHFGEGDIIFREGDEAPQFYVLLSGRVALEANFGGRQVRIDTLFVGDELGWSAVLKRQKQFQARALSLCKRWFSRFPACTMRLTGIPILAGRFWSGC